MTKTQKEYYTNGFLMGTTAMSILTVIGFNLVVHFTWEKDLYDIMNILKNLW